jgi:ATP-dependent RNA helicase DDX24/MAK5
MGFFLGLEVIAPDDYKLETDPETGVKRFRVVKEQPAKHAAAEEEAEVLDSRQHVPEEAALETHPEGKATVPPRQDAKYTGPRKKGVTATDHHKRGKDGYDSDAALEENAEKHAPRKFEGTVLDRHKRDDDSDGVSRMQMAWLTSTGGVELHPGLCRSLVSLGFWSPTPIQAATLPASILGKRNIVGCAPTGSGKTLAFLLPILQELLVQDEEQRAEQALATSGLRPLEALVLSPTRELALQIQQACDSLVPRVSAAVVGGLAVAKQTRLLDRQPPIVVGTPGRLWDLVRTSGCLFFCAMPLSMKTFRSLFLDIRLK